MKFVVMLKFIKFELKKLRGKHYALFAHCSTVSWSPISKEPYVSISRTAWSIHRFVGTT